MRALIVDDTRFVRSDLRSLLEGKGIECAEAADDPADIEMLRRGAAFALALLEWNMLGGMEV